MTTPVRVTDEFPIFANAAAARFTRVAALPNGSFVAVTMDDLPGAGDFVFVTGHDALGGFLGEQGFGGVKSSERPSIAVLSDGEAVIGYVNTQGGVAGQISTDTGSIPFSTSLGQGASVAALNGGNIAVAWSFSGTGDITIQRFDTAGQSIGTASSHQTPGNASKVEMAALTGGGFVVGYTSSQNSNDPGFHIFNNDGTFRTSGISEPSASPSNNTETDVFIIALADGGFVSAFTLNPFNGGGDGSEDGIFYVVHDSQGAKVGATSAGPLQANTTATGNQRNVAGTALSDGGFVLVWQDLSVASDIRAQVFNSDGTPRDGEFLVATGLAVQTDPSVTELADGRIAFAWDDNGLGTRGVIFDPRQTGIIKVGTNGDDQYFGSDFSDLMFGRGGDDILEGGQQADLLDGGGGDDTLDGDLGSDELKGGKGDDAYAVDELGDTVIELDGNADGIDTILTATINIDLTRAAHGDGNVENVTAAGAVQMRGNALGNVLDGRSFAAGVANAMFGRGGNDTYIIGARDTVSEAGGGGTDTVLTSLFSINLASFARIENATLTGSGAFKLTGTAGANVLTGNDGINRITGGRGVDTMNGGAGAVRDVFDFNAVNETGKTAAARDKILGFQHLRDDIDLSTIDANGAAAGHKFTFLAAKGAAFNGVRGELRWFQENKPGAVNDKTIIEGDINGNQLADFQIELKGLIALSGADFIL